METKYNTMLQKWPIKIALRVPFRFASLPARQGTASAAPRRFYRPPLRGTPARTIPHGPPVIVCIQTAAQGADTTSQRRDSCNSVRRFASTPASQAGRLQGSGSATPKSTPPLVERPMHGHPNKQTAMPHNTTAHHPPTGKDND